MNKYISYLIVGFLCFILGASQRCSPESDNRAGKEQIIKTKTVYTPITRIDTIKIDNPVIHYQYKDKIITVTNTDTILEKFKPSDYKYTYKKSIWTSGNRARVDMDIKGWGSLSSLDYIVTEHDTLAETTITKVRPESGLFVTAGYDNLKQPSLGLNYVIRNKVMVALETQLINKTPTAGVKIGYRIK